MLVYKFGFSFGNIGARFDSRYRFVKHGGLLWSLMSGDRSFISKDTVALLSQNRDGSLLGYWGCTLAWFSALMYGLVRLFLCSFLDVWSTLSIFQILPCLGSIVAAVLYAQHVGWPTSAQRSVCGFLGVMALLVGRKIHVWTILCSDSHHSLSRAFSIGFFELSSFFFSAVAGILVFPSCDTLDSTGCSSFFSSSWRSFCRWFGSQLGNIALGWTVFSRVSMDWADV